MSVNVTLSSNRLGVSPSGGTLSVSLSPASGVQSFSTKIADRYVIANTANYAFSTDGTDLFWSTDGGDTWINQFTWGLQYSVVPSRDFYITTAWIFNDGTLMFGTYDKMWRSTDSLLTVNEITPTGYTLHTPVFASRPGAYFQSLNYDDVQIMDGVEMRVWGNYGNTPKAGATPLVVWYTIDKGATIKKAFEFGQNPYMTDTGAESGQYGGALLGDAGEALQIRHIHSCTFDGVDSWYVCTGDQSPRDNQVEVVEEIHWIKLTYDDVLDSWAKVDIHSDSATGETTRYKSTGVNIIGGYVYFGSDGTSAVAGGAEEGVFKCLIADIDNPGNHVRLLDFSPDAGVGNKYNIIDMKVDPVTGFMVIVLDSGVGGGFNNKFAISFNFGADGTYTIIDLEPGGNGPLCKIYPKNTAGFFKIDSDYTYFEQGNSLFVKEI